MVREPEVVQVTAYKAANGKTYLKKEDAECIGLWDIAEAGIIRHKVCGPILHSRPIELAAWLVDNRKALVEILKEIT